MSLPDKCPFCGSGGEYKNPEKWASFTCMTTIYAGHDERRMQSITCAGLERTRLLARVAELERELERAKADRARAAMDARNPLMAQLAELEARCKRLEEAMELVAQMRQRWLEREDDGYAGAYYAFVKGKDDEWDAIMQAKEAKP